MRGVGGVGGRGEGKEGRRGREGRGEGGRGKGEMEGGNGRGERGKGERAGGRNGEREGLGKSTNGLTHLPLFVPHPLSPPRPSPSPVFFIIPIILQQSVRIGGAFDCPV